jgi:diadenosine tetraphosphate (Ap4A) HIT family hydrolase
MNTQDCPFCNLPPVRIIQKNPSCSIVRDGYPVSPGHTLIISNRHVGSFFDLSAVEQQDLLELLSQARKELDETHKPDAYNIGVNDGLAAGQTIPHFHLHLIPRYKGDRPDPKGGVRWIFPDKANYWSDRQTN